MQNWKFEAVDFLVPQSLEHHFVEIRDVGNYPFTSLDYYHRWKIGKLVQDLTFSLNAPSQCRQNFSTYSLERLYPSLKCLAFRKLPLPTSKPVRAVLRLRKWHELLRFPNAKLKIRSRRLFGSTKLATSFRRNSRRLKLPLHIPRLLS